MDKVALVLGATGGVGGAIARSLIRAGWQVRGLRRKGTEGLAEDGITWVRGDAMVAGDVMAAAKGAQVIVHAVNPPGYRNWDKLVLPMIDNTIAAAKKHGARIVLPGTIYNFDPHVTQVITSHTNQNGSSRKGKVRIELEKRLLAASVHAPVLIVRAGDFFGPGARSSWFTQLMAKPGLPLKRIINPAKGGGHSWAYLPDLANAIVGLLERADQLESFEDIPFAGHFDKTGREMIDAICAVEGKNLPVYSFPWWTFSIGALFDGFAREAVEIAPYWSHPVRLENDRLLGILGAEPHTPLVEAVGQALRPDPAQRGG